MSADEMFDVIEEVVVGDLSAVQQAIVPMAQNVRVRIAKATVEKSKDGALKNL